MKVTPLALGGVFLVDLEPRADERGFFARSFCVDEFASRGIPMAVLQENVSYNAQRGTLRGMHFQREPHGEKKLIRCTRGAIHDVVVDVREGSPTRGRSVAVELTAENRSALYVPSGFAHGFLTLSDGAEVLYAMGTPYVAELAAGFRYDDPAFAIRWPFAPVIISTRDLEFPPFVP